MFQGFEREEVEASMKSTATHRKRAAILSDDEDDDDGGGQSQDAEQLPVSEILPDVSSDENEDEARADSKLGSGYIWHEIVAVIILSFPSDNCETLRSKVSFMK